MAEKSRTETLLKQIAKNTKNPIEVKYQEAPMRQRYGNICVEGKESEQFDGMKANTIVKLTIKAKLTNSGIRTWDKDTPYAEFEIESVDYKK